MLKKMSKEIERRSRTVEYDAVFSQTSVLCSYYRGEKPIVFYTDASFGGMLDYYWNPNDWVTFNLKHGNEVEKKLSIPAAVLYTLQNGQQKALQDVMIQILENVR